MNLSEKLSSLSPQEHDAYLKALWAAFKTNEMYEALELAIQRLYRERTQAAAQFTLTPDQRTFLLGGAEALTSLLIQINAAATIDLSKVQYERTEAAPSESFDYTNDI